MSETKETKKCKHCQSDIPKKAKVCPNCKKKQGGILKWVIIAIVVLGLIGSVAGGGSDDGESGNSGNPTKSAENTNNEKDKKPTPTEIAYEICSIDDMMETLNTNALKAETTYQDKYVEVTGKLNVIDSDGKYISIVPDEQFAIIGIQCYIKNDEQKEKIIEMSIGDMVTVKGKIKSIGEVLGYSLDLDSIE